MSDRNSAFENQQELKFAGEQGFFDKSPAIRFLIVGAFACVLFFFLHVRETRIEMLELKSIAPNYVISQVDFDFPDEEATAMLRQEAVRDIGRIYRLLQKDIRQKRIEFENFLLYNQAWYEQAESGTFHELYRATERMENLLLQMRFTDAHTLERLDAAGLPTNGYYVYSPNLLIEQTLLPAFIWDNLQKENFPPAAFNPFISALVLEFFRNSHWHIEEDIPARSLLHKKIQAQVQEKTTHIHAGNRIIDQGEQVSPRHIAMMQAMKAELGKSRNLWNPSTLLGTALLTALFIGIFWAYLHINQPKLLVSNRKLFILVTVLVLILLLTKLTEFVLLSSTYNWINWIRYPILAPLAAILLCSLMNPALAAFSSAFLAIVSALSLVFDWEGFLILNLTAAFVSILSIRSLRKRKEIFVVCLKAWLCCVAVVLALHLYNNALWQFETLADMASTGFFMLLTAILVVGLLPLLESTFKIMTDVSLTEYMDPNTDLLRRLTIEAPGTYQHSVVVGNLAESAALAIGANGLFCRVATLYHDVGKMITPQYFTENQMSQVNIHQLLTPHESAHVIMAHVPEGVTLAREAGLPEAIIDIIKEHHGTTLVYYFYRKQLEKAGEDKSHVDEREFRYTGPKPRSKESGIIMIADSFEAASRSLEEVNEENLTMLVDRLVRDKIDDGQFTRCLLTFEELSIVKKTLIKTLMASGHTRIKYPKRAPVERAALLEESA